jgi:hypothetical protein
MTSRQSKGVGRREIGIGLALAGVAGAAKARPAVDSAAPGLRPVFDLEVVVAPAQELGEVGGGRRRVIPILGGTLVGEGMRGEVRPGGADWQTIRPDGVTLLQARYTVRMETGETIGIVNTGIRRAEPDIVRRLTAGEIVDPSLYYFRAAPVFEVGPGRYQWLTESLFVSVGERLPDKVRLKVYRVD